MFHMYQSRDVPRVIILNIVHILFHVENHVDNFSSPFRMEACGGDLRDWLLKLFDKLFMSPRVYTYEDEYDNRHPHS